MNHYEALIEDYHGHCCREQFDAEDDEQAKKIAHHCGYKYFANDDKLWRVKGEYVDWTCYDRWMDILYYRNYKQID